MTPKNDLLEYIDSIAEPVTAEEAMRRGDREPIPEFPAHYKLGRLAVIIGFTVVLAALSLAGLFAVYGDEDPPIDSNTAPTLITVPSSEVPDTTQIPTGAIPIDPGPLGVRFGTSKVWTGAEVIVWGGNGEDLSDTFDDGAAFDPDTGEWRRIASPPLDGMTWHFAAWSGDEMLVVGTSGAAAYDPVNDSWRRLPDPPISIRLADEDDPTEYAWSGSHVYVWNPASDELARLDPPGDTWMTMKGPGVDGYPAKIVAGNGRLVAFGTRWPDGPGDPWTYELFGAELIDGAWVELTPVDFRGSDGSANNLADPGTATFVGDRILVWGTPGPNPGNARLLNPDGSWTEVPPPPIDENMALPEPISLDDGRVLALSEGGNAAIWEPESLNWTPIGPLPWIQGNDDAVWTGKEVIAWHGSEAWRWAPPPPSTIPAPK